MASNFKSETDIRILLIGRTGHGKSSTGNTITGREIFKVSGASTSETKTSMWSGVCKRFGRTVEVVDTPGMFDTDQHNYAVHKELLRSLALTTPGFHVIAFVLMRGKFTEEIQKTQDLFFNWFGQGVENFACIILTDTIDEDSMNKYLKYKPHEKLTDLVQKCNRRVVPLNNHASCDVTDGQIERILQMAEEIKNTNSHQHFSNVVLQLAEAYAKSKCPKELTPDSIHILQTAGLRLQFTKKQCSYFNFVFKLTEKIESNEDAEKKENHSSDTQSDDISDTEETEYMLPKQCGNLSIFDSCTNEPISNTILYERKERPRQKRIYNSTETKTTSTSSHKNTHSDEVQGRRATVSDVYREENEIDYGPAAVTSLSMESKRPREERKHEISRKTPNNQGDCHPGHQSSMDSNKCSRKLQDDRSENPRSGRKPNRSRANRIVDMSTVHFDPKDRTRQGTQSDQNSAQHNLGQNRKSRSSQASSVVHPESVQYDPTNEFKTSINDEEEKITGFLNHIKDAWRYCKNTFGCILL